MTNDICFVDLMEAVEVKRSIESVVMCSVSRYVLYYIVMCIISSGNCIVVDLGGSHFENFTSPATVFAFL